MTRFEAWYDCGEVDERAPEWLVVEWTFHDGRGNRMGQTAEWCRNQEEAERVAAALNAAYEQELFANQECEFDIAP